MNIILVSSRLAKAVSLGPKQVALALTLAAMLIGGACFALGALLASSRSVTQLTRFVPNPRQAEIDALAVKLGELQAKLVRLDGLAKQVGQKSGVDVKPFLSGEAAPRGGAAQEGAYLSADDLLRQLTGTETLLSAYHDQLSLAEAVLMLPDTKNLPALPPVSLSLGQSSGFGARIDPLSGKQTFHEGIDFVGDVGTPVKASGRGVVTFAGYHVEYGNMVDLDHGNGLTSRYAHNAKLMVRKGGMVEAGQVIAQLGNSGRSTGAHLHYEIRYKNVPQNPLRFMATEVAAGKIPALRP
ncbi:Peptidase family M23 [Formivibrio citricus]|uniref:Peptidase family M23 n=1 Tax=Formivibrio citricus TaxID=83765 RepID=A0A1I4VKI1_9NEIS|nr:M23 family metallopeptidase [Formivibrio citricus]SFN01663.1 Peptidase family M23 [Formivibrio citricus]